MSRAEKQTLDANGNVIRINDPVTLWINGKRDSTTQEMSGHPGWRVASISRIISRKLKKGIFIQRANWFDENNFTKSERIVVNIQHPGYKHKIVSPDSIVKAGSAKKTKPKK
ncbi:MAG: hypothetical protein RLZZ283_392 [Candidatus Parcubacteria bacterium]|jgi:hypothetical protein